MRSETDYIKKHQPTARTFCQRRYYNRKRTIGFEQSNSSTSIEWGRILSTHLSTVKLHNISAVKWAADLFYIDWRHILKIWWECCENVQGKNPAEIEQNLQNRCFQEIQHIQSINQNLTCSNHDWILANREDLQDYSSQNLQIWLYGVRSKNYFT
jgi:hypothetical protein